MSTGEKIAVAIIIFAVLYSLVIVPGSYEATLLYNSRQLLAVWYCTYITSLTLSCCGMFYMYEGFRYENYGKLLLGTVLTFAGLGMFYTVGAALCGTSSSNVLLYKV